MVYGYFPDNINVPYIEVSVFSGQNILHSTFILDTGFSGDLKMDDRMADELGIVAFEEGYITNAKGEKIRARRARGYAELEGRKKLIDIFIFPGAALAGIGLFSIFGYKAVVDCKNKTAHLERVV